MKAVKCISSCDFPFALKCVPSIPPIPLVGRSVAHVRSVATRDMKYLPTRSTSIFFMASLVVVTLDERTTKMNE